MPTNLPSDTLTQIPPTAAQLPVTVDIVALTVLNSQLSVLLVERSLNPYQGKLALPGGFILPGESLEEAAERELSEEAGLDANEGLPFGHLEQLRTYGPLDRDPRGPILSVAYLLLLPATHAPTAGGDAGQAGWIPTSKIIAEHNLAFDHQKILAEGIERARAKLEYSPLATSFCPPEFTIAQLREIYEAVWGVTLDPRNFHRKATSTPGFLEPTGTSATYGTGRPAALYRLTSGVGVASPVLQPPLMRPEE